MKSKQLRERLEKLARDQQQQLIGTLSGFLGTLIVAHSFGLAAIVFALLIGVVILHVLN